MFTGLIQEVGQITNITPLNGGITCAIKFETLLKGLSIGDSVAVNGVCSTVKEILDDGITVDYMEETLSKTTFNALETTMKVNLERSLTPTDQIGGHFVSGHVDTVGEIKQLEVKEPWGVIEVSFPKEFAPYLVSKGSIAIDGISLTVVAVFDDSFTCHLIPHTISQTTLHSKGVGDTVNLESDLLAKYLHRFYSLSQQ